MDVWTLKVISIPIVAVVNFLSGFLPYFLISRNIGLPHSTSDHSSPSASPLSPAMRRFLTLSNFFCAGVFLSMCIIGLYPGVNSKFNNIVKKNPFIPHYPYAGLSLAFGFFFVWVLEILVHHCIHCHSSSGHGHGHDHGDSHDHDQDLAHSHDHRQSSAADPNSNNVMKMHPLRSAQSEVEDSLLSNCDDQEVLKGVLEVVDQEPHEPHSHVPITGNILGSAMLTFALGSHSIIEGLGFGVLDEVNLTINMLVTVLIHESICAISLGVNVASKKVPIKPAIVLLVIFSILIPVGIGLGLIVDSGLQKNLLGEVVIAVLQGVAAGTFIYVVFMEILPGELAHRRDPLLRLFIMVVGFIVIAGMKATHSHSDGQRASNQTSLPATSVVAHTH